MDDPDIRLEGVEQVADTMLAQWLEEYPPESLSHSVIANEINRRKKIQRDWLRALLGITTVGATVLYFLLR